MNWTRAQKEAIEANNRTVLVSAAAGSGKTAVLVERVVRLIREGGDIRRMLIVTFTRAAAAEMRERIADVLQKSDDARLRKQALLVSSAHISTLHVFCQFVIREHFQALGIDPQASIGEEAQLSQLLSRAMTDALEEACEAPTPEQRQLFDRFDVDQTLAMAERLRRFLMALPDPWTWADDHLRPYHGKLQDHPAFRALMQECLIQLQSALPLLLRCKEALDLPNAPIRYDKTVIEDERLLDDLLHAAADGSLRGGKLRFSPLPRGKKNEPDDPEATEAFQASRAQFKKALQSAIDLLPADDDLAVEDMNASLIPATGLVQLLKAIQAKYDAYKDERSLLDFHDLEHLCIRALRIDSIQKACSDLFDAIFIDEYQDVSAIQEEIIRRIHIGNTLFLVGDVKQSIYRFRHADPTLFLNKFLTFSLDRDAAERKIVLQQNFRSAKNILSAVNLVFEGAMRKSVTQIDYREDARLYPGEQAPDGPAVELHLLEKKDPETGEAARLTQAHAYEALLIADQIKRLTTDGTTVAEKSGTRPLQYRDIVILLRSAAAHAALFAKTLQENGIPVYCDADAQYYELPEVNDILNLLRVIDNPYQDIPLLGALRCPCFDFSQEELARIRLVETKPKTPFHVAFFSLAKNDAHPLHDKLRVFTEKIDAWRFVARTETPETLIRLLTDETGLYALAGTSEDGEARQANLRLLSERAARCVNIAEFLSTVDQQLSAEDSRTAKTLSDQENVVRIMTMHKSKGLEFPVVFLAELGRAFRSPAGERPLLDQELGLSLPLIEPEQRLIRPTILSDGITAASARKNLSEEARILYVAMTRARERLILYGSPSKLEASLPIWRLPRGDAAAAGAGCMLDWIAQAVLPGLEQGADTVWESENGSVWKIRYHNVETLTSEQRDKKTVSPRFDTGVVSPWLETLLARKNEAFHPVKVSVSAVAKQHLPEAEEEETPETKRAVSRETLEDRPRFMQQSGFTAAERGTAMHKALGLIPYEPIRAARRLDRSLFIQLLDELVDNERLTPEERRVVHPDDLLRFFLSPVGQRALHATVLRREWSFNLRLDDRTVIQGVLDLCFLEEGQWVLVDYKTDHIQDLSVLVDRYQAQIGWYARALAQLTGKDLREALRYSVRLHRAISVD